MLRGFIPGTRDEPGRRRRIFAGAALAAALVFPSLKVQRYVGTVGTAAYVVAGAAAAALFLKYLLYRLAARISDRGAVLAAVATVAAAAVLVVAMYPWANAGLYGGSDRDDALNLAGTNILAGRYPYDGVTYAGNPINKMPGAIFFALPFVAMGTSAYQNLFWLVILFFTWRALFRSGGRAVTLLWVTLGFAPVVWHELVTGGDLLANGIWVCVFTVALVRAVTGRGVPAAVKVGAAVLFGLGLASRLNFALVVPVVFSFLGRRVGWRQAAAYVGVAVAAAAGATLPFYLYDPARFTGLASQNKAALMFGWAGVAVPLVGAAWAVALAFQRMDRRGVALYRNAALALAFPVVSCVVLYSAHVGEFNVEAFAWYGVSFLFFGVTAAGLALFRWREAAPARAPAAVPAPLDARLEGYEG